MNTAYIDECKGKGYIFAVNLVNPKSQTALRELLNKQLLPGQRSVHFRKESFRRRKALIKRISNMGFRLVILKSVSSKPNQARQILIRHLVKVSPGFQIDYLVFELDITSVQQDSKLLSDLRSSLNWDHRQRHQEPLLWVPDAVAWCLNRGGEWARMVRPMIVETIDC